MRTFCFRSRKKPCCGGVGRGAERQGNGQHLDSVFRGQIKHGQSPEDRGGLGVRLRDRQQLAHGKAALWGL